MTLIHLPEGSFVHHGAMLELSEAHQYLMPGRYPVVGRRPGEKPRNLVLVIGIGRARLDEPPLANVARS